MPDKPPKIFIPGQEPAEVRNCPLHSMIPLEFISVPSDEGIVMACRLARCFTCGLELAFGRPDFAKKPEEGEK